MKTQEQQKAEDKKFLIKDHNCIKCNDLIKCMDDNMVLFDGGVVSYITAGYGSSLDLNQYVIAICDNCITENLEFVKNVLYPELPNPKVK